MKCLITALIFLLFLSGCVFGPKLKNKTAYLNGDSYTGVNVTGVLKTKKRMSRISGTVYYKLADSINFNYSYGYKILLKNRENKIVDEFVLDRKGNFNFRAQLPNDAYLLEVKKGNETAKLKRINLNGYLKEGIEIFL